MCRWRQVCNIYLRCGHRESLPEVLITCDNANCRFSPYHSPTCVLPACASTCWQYRQFPEQYSPNLDRLCPACIAATQRTPDRSRRYY